jgi:hypothetical protein
VVSLTVCSGNKRCSDDTSTCRLHSKADAL